MKTPSTCLPAVGPRRISTSFLCALVTAGLLVTSTTLTVFAMRSMALPAPVSNRAADSAAAQAAPELFFPVVPPDAGQLEVAIQALGSKDSGVMLLLFAGGITDWTLAKAPAPMAVLCGSAAPGAAVRFADDRFASTAASAVAFSLSKDSSGIGGLAAGESPFNAACGLAARKIKGDAAGYIAFKRAFEEGGTWEGVRWRDTWGNPLVGLARLQAQRHNAVLGHSIAAGSPAGVRPATDAILPAPQQNITGTTASYALPLAASSQPSVDAQVTLQNAGNASIRVFVWTFEAGRPRRILCDDGYSVLLPAGAALPLCLKRQRADSTLLVQAQGTGTQPRLAIHVGMEENSLHQVTAGFRGDLAVASSLALPLPVAVAEGMSVLVQLVNPSAGDALVEVAWEDGKGGDVLRRRQILKQWDSVTVDLGASPVPSLPTQGLVRVRSLNGSGGGATAGGPPVSAVLVLQTLVSDAPRTSVLTGLLAEPFPAVGTDAAGERGGLLAVPLLQKDRDGITELSLLDAAEGDGFTDLRLAILDANGLLDVDCTRVSHNRVQVWDLRNMGTLPSGFRGSGIISAEYWEHDRTASGGGLQVPGADLVASVVMRSRSGEQPMETAAESLARYPASSISDPILPLLPPCPGVPTRVPPASATPSATSTPPPSATPSATLTPRVTPTWTASPSPSPSPTPSRPRIFLPAVLVGSDPWPLGLVLVVDVLAGSPLERSEPAAIPLSAARRLGLTALDLLRPREDSAALVQFDAAAQVLSLGRAADVAAALRALAEVDLTATARPDLGLAAADLALRDLRGSAGAQRGAVLLFVDGSTEPEAFEKAVIRSGRLRSAGVAVFALGFGEQGAGPTSALERIAGSAQNLHWVGDGEAGLVEAGDALERWAASGWQRLGSAAPVWSRGPAH